MHWVDASMVQHQKTSSGEEESRKNKRKCTGKGDDELEVGNDRLSRTSSKRDVSVEDDSNTSSLEPNINLSKDELLKLLSVFEGELQARDEVIAILKSECSQNPDMRYGLTSQPLKALQRDGAILEMTSQDHVCEQTREQLQKIIQHQKQSHKKLEQMHLASEEKYQRLATEVEEEKRKHQEYVLKSEDFVNLLERDRERLKQILEQEKSIFNRKERELIRKLKENKEEVIRMKSLSIELVEDRQRQLQEIGEQKQLTATLEKNIDELQLKVQETESLLSAEKEHALQLENELEDQTNSHYQAIEAFKNELEEEKVKNKEKDEKIKSQGRQMQKLKCVDKDLRKTDDKLWRIKEKLEQEEKYDDLLEEVELLRKTVAAMQEAEKIYTEAHEECKDLREALKKELIQTKGLREEVEKLRKNTRNRTEIERCIEETMFRFDEMQQVCDAEYKKQSIMKKEIHDFRGQLQKIDESEVLLKLNEVKIKQLQATVEELKADKCGLETKLQIEKDKSAQYKDMIDDERNKVTEVTQKAIEESKKVLKAKGQLATLENKLVEDTKNLNKKLEAAETNALNMITKEKSDQMEILINNLRKQVAMLKKRLDALEEEYEKKEQEMREAKKEADTAKKNLQLSTDQLKRLVVLGLGEQINAAEKSQKKQNILEISKLDDDVKTLESQLIQANNNNNNLCLKGVAVSHSSTQTIAKDEQLSSKGPTVRRLSRSNSSSGAESKPPSLKRGPSVTRRDISVERTKAPFKVGTATTRRTSAASLSSKKSSIKSDSTPITQTSGVSSRLKSVEKVTSSSASRDPASDSPFRGVGNSKLGNFQIETRVADAKKGNCLSNQQRETTFNKTSSITSTKTSSRELTNSKVSKAAANPTSFAITSSKAKQPTSVEPRSATPTGIPTFRSGTPTSPVPTLTSRSSNVRPLR